LNVGSSSNGFGVLRREKILERAVLINPLLQRSLFLLLLPSDHSLGLRAVILPFPLFLESPPRTKHGRQSSHSCYMRSRKAKTLGDATEGLIRSLDVRFWQPDPSQPEFWLEDKTIPGKYGQTIRLSALDVRKSLIAFLYGLEVYRPAANFDNRDGFADGAALFNRDCASCHQPRNDQNAAEFPALITRNMLAKQGYLFYAPLFAKTGVEPVFTPYGNRVSPLIELSSGGPYMTNGQFKTLREMLLAFDPDSQSQHYRSERRSSYSDEEIKNFLAFLERI